MQTFHKFVALPGSASRRNDGTPLKVVTVPYSIQISHSSPLTGSFKCQTVLIKGMSTLLCLKRILEKFNKSVIFGKNTFFSIFVSFKTFSFAL